MAPRLPERYELRIRLGRDHDVEEWLAADTGLDRPVLVRFLGPEADETRAAAFLDAMRGAAGTTHVHLAEVYAVGQNESGTFAVMEWCGGMTLADRVAAGDTMPVEEYLPNAAGLAAALDTLHNAGVVHGSVSPSAVQYSSAHPAKLGAYGRPVRHASITDDVTGLTKVLTFAITGSTDSEVPLSQLTEGISPGVDDALAAAREGSISAAGLVAAFQAAPSLEAPPESPPPSWRWLWVAAGLFAAALLLAGIGLALNIDPDSPLLFPATPQASPTTTTPPPTTIATTTTVTDGPAPLSFVAAVHDPFGDGTELDERLAELSDADPETGWRTERYFDPLPDLKPGVGVVFDVDGAPSVMELTASPGTRFRVAWAESPSTDFAAWEDAADGEIVSGRTSVDLPTRSGGVWLLWLTDLASQESGEYFYSWVYEVRFLE